MDILAKIFIGMLLLLCFAAYGLGNVLAYVFPN